MIVALQGLPKSWNDFANRISSSKNSPSFEEMWYAYIQEEACISLIRGTQEDEENTSNSYLLISRRKEEIRSSKGQRKIIRRLPF